MKILQVHNIYQNRGGEDMVVEQEKSLLVQQGHEVLGYFRHNDEIKGFREKLNVLLTAHYSKKSRELFRETLMKAGPDIVHVHNFFPLITPSIFDACQDLNIPVVMTLHNYRLLHPNGLLIDNRGEIDERSVRGSAYACVPDKVYRNSIVQTAVVAHMIEYHRKARTWHSKVDRFIALTNFAKAKFGEGGLPLNRISVKPNYAMDIFEKDEKPQKSRGRHFVFVGRLSPEKGIAMLVDTWIKHGVRAPLTIIGEGPLQQGTINKSKENQAVKVLGKMPHDGAMRHLRQAKAMVFPSTCYEGFPMTIVEAFSLGVPVIASNIGSQQEIVRHGHNGLHFEKGNGQSLSEQVSKLDQDDVLREKLSVNARADYLKLYTPETNYQQLMHIYQQAIEEKSRKPRH